VWVFDDFEKRKKKKGKDLKQKRGYGNPVTPYFTW
jgi:hypothetical protein